MNNGIEEEAIGANQTIIIVSTDPLKRNRIVHYLSAAGYAVLEAASGAEALDLARKFEREIEVVFVDDQSSDINAPALAAVIKRVRPAARVLRSSELDVVGSDNRGFPATILIQALQRALGSYEA